MAQEEVYIIKRKLAAAFATAILFVSVAAAALYFTFTPGKPPALLLFLGETAERCGLGRPAAYLYEQALLFSPGNARARLRLAAVLHSADEPERAEAVLRDGIALPGSPVSMYCALSKLLIDQGRLDEAVAFIDGAGNGITGLRLNALRPSVSVRPAPGSYSSPVSFEIEPCDGVSFYYSLSDSPSAWNACSAPLLLQPGSFYRIQVVAVSADGLPSRLHVFCYDIR